MKRVAQRVEIDLPPVRLFLEDLEFLVERLSQQGTKLRIEHRGFQYESLEELKAHVSRPTIRNLGLTAQQQTAAYGTALVVIKPAGVRIYADDSLADVARSIAEYLRAKVPWYSWLPGGSSWWYMLRGALEALLITGIALVILTALPFGLVWGILAAGAFAIAVFVLLSGADRIVLGKSVVYLDPSAARRSFWDRHQDAIKLSAITSLISGVIGFLFGRLLR